MAEQREGIIHCSFCGRNQHEVRRMIAGQQAFICDECVALCVDRAGSRNLSRGAAGKDRTPRDEDT